MYSRIKIDLHKQQCSVHTLQYTTTTTMSQFTFDICCHTIKGEPRVLHTVSGKTYQKTGNGRPVNIDMMSINYRHMADDMICEKNSVLKRINGYTYKNKHFQEGMMDKWHTERFTLDTEYNWKLRVLLELSNNEKDAQLLLDFANKVQQQHDNDMKNTYSKKHHILKNKESILIRRVSQRIRAKQNK